MEEPFNLQRFNLHILPAIHQCIEELSHKLKSVAQRLRRGKRLRKDKRIANIRNDDQLNSAEALNSQISSDNSEELTNRNLSDVDTNNQTAKDDNTRETLLMANSISYKQLIINILRLISYIYRSSNVSYNNLAEIMKAGTIDFSLLKKISIPLIDQLFNQYHIFGNKFFFISRRKKVSEDMRLVMSHSTIAMNFLFKLIFEISPCALITVLFMYIQNDDYAKTCCSILRDHLIPYITKYSRLRHEQLVYEMRLRQMIMDKDYMQLFDILRIDIERIIYRKFSLSSNLNSSLKSLYITKFHMYKRNTKYIHYFEADEAVQLISKKGNNATLIVFIKGMCEFIFDVIELKGENLEDKSWAERLEVYRPKLNERCQEIIRVTEIHESELDILVLRPTFIYVKTCGFGLGTFFETFHKYEKKGRRIPMTSKLPRDNGSFMLHDSLEKAVQIEEHKVNNDYDVVDQL